jgi:hypothetical protein
MKHLRGQLLDFLKRIYPRNIEELGIISVFYEYYRDKDIRQSLQYLVDKGYVEKEERKHPYRRREKVSFYKISAKGIDLIEGTIDDAGVILEDE